MLLSPRVPRQLRGAAPLLSDATQGSLRVNAPGGVSLPVAITPLGSPALTQRFSSSGSSAHRSEPDTGTSLGRTSAAAARPPRAARPRCPLPASRCTPSQSHAAAKPASACATPAPQRRPSRACMPAPAAPRGGSSTPAARSASAQVPSSSSSLHAALSKACYCAQRQRRGGAHARGAAERQHDRLSPRCFSRSLYATNLLALGAPSSQA